MARYPSAPIDRRHIGVPREGQIGHFGYFSPRMQDSLWRDTADWLDRVLARSDHRAV